jgi:hypothetical protein
MLFRDAHLNHAILDAAGIAAMPIVQPMAVARATNCYRVAAPGRDRLCIPTEILGMAVIIRRRHRVAALSMALPRSVFQRTDNDNKAAVNYSTCSRT